MHMHMNRTSLRLFSADSRANKRCLYSSAARRHLYFNGMGDFSSTCFLITSFCGLCVPAFPTTPPCTGDCK